jgi:hypothetical protein
MIDYYYYKYYYHEFTMSQTEASPDSASLVQRQEKIGALMVVRPQVFTTQDQGLQHSRTTHPMKCGNLGKGT